ncbi:MAG TPA: NADP-dependent oxidoreductase [Bacteriovoracaceae bacterium]|nr:NADP-dependent oxidoreductase [Bacteriovoracaceae bacterium]
MKAIQIHNYGHSDQLKIENIPEPTPGENEVFVEVHAVGVNPMDWKIREGLYKDMMPVDFPLTVGQDFSGQVIGTGENTHGFQKGDMVYGFAPGAYAEFVCVNEATIAKIPEDVDYITAAAIPTAGLTAYQLIMNAIDLKADQTVLIQGAGGGVGSFAVQLALWKKAKIIATADGGDIEFLKKMGITEIINFEREKFEDRVKDVDAVIDLVGGDTLKRSYAVLKKGGVIATTVGQVDEDVLKQIGARGVNFVVKQNSEDLAHLANLVDQDILRPRIFEVFPLEEARRAQDDLQRHHSHGKIILEVRPS